MSSIVVPAPPTIVVPGGQQPGFVPAPGSGILVPVGAGTVHGPARRSVFVPAPGTRLDADTMLAQARAGYAALAAADGAGVAQMAVGPQLAVIDRVAAEERHQAALAAFYAGQRLGAPAAPAR